MTFDVYCYDGHLGTITVADGPDAEDDAYEAAVAQFGYRKVLGHATISVQPEDYDPDNE